MLRGGVRWPVIIVAAVISIVTYTPLAVWDGVAPGWKWACYVGAGLGGGIGPTVVAWAAEIKSDDSEERAVVTSPCRSFHSLCTLGSPCWFGLFLMP